LPVGGTTSRPTRTTAPPTTTSSSPPRAGAITRTGADPIAGAGFTGGALAARRAVFWLRSPSFRA